MKIYFPFMVLLFCASCSTLRNSPKTEFKDGYYKQQYNEKARMVYVNVTEDDIVAYPTIKTGTGMAVDTTAKTISYKTELKNDVSRVISFKKGSFDLDFITIPLKFRMPQKGVPGQLNANLNGAVYVGYRSDDYRLSYIANPLKKAERHTNHYGFSYGIFSGLGNTAMNPTNTDKHIIEEYDGIVWSKGVAGIIAVDNFTVGLTFGADNLLDGNRRYWIYENKFWTGLAFGLNLN